MSYVLRLTVHHRPHIVQPSFNHRSTIVSPSSHHRRPISGVIPISQWVRVLGGVATRLVYHLARLAVPGGGSRRACVCSLKRQIRIPHSHASIPSFIQSCRSFKKTGGLGHREEDSLTQLTCTAEHGDQCSCVGILLSTIPG
jgi:hypothetical protein